MRPLCVDAGDAQLLDDSRAPESAWLRQGWQFPSITKLFALQIYA